MLLKNLPVLTLKTQLKTLKTEKLNLSPKIETQEKSAIEQTFQKQRQQLTGKKKTRY